MEQTANYDEKVILRESTGDVDIETTYCRHCGANNFRNIGRLTCYNCGNNK